MTRILYKLKSCIGEIRDISGEGVTLTIAIKPDTDGYITLAGVTKRLVKGECRFNLERIPDGDYTPLLSGASNATLEPIRKAGGRILPLPTPDSTVRRLLERTEALEDKCDGLKEELTSIRALLDSRIIL